MYELGYLIGYGMVLMPILGVFLGMFFVAAQVWHSLRLLFGRYEEEEPVVEPKQPCNKKKRSVHVVVDTFSEEYTLPTLPFS